MSEVVSSICRSSRYPIITRLLSEVVLCNSFSYLLPQKNPSLFLSVTCLARYTAITIILSTLTGGVVLSVRPITKLLFPFVCDRLSRLETYFSQHAGSLQELQEDIKILLPIWIEEEWCEVAPSHIDDVLPKTLSGARPALLLPPPAPLAKEESTSLPRVLPKITYEIQPQVQKPDFDPEGWLLV